jgi:hypothetical protein
MKTTCFNIGFRRKHVGMGQMGRNYSQVSIKLDNLKNIECLVLVNIGEKFLVSLNILISKLE